MAEPTSDIGSMFRQLFGGMGGTNGQGGFASFIQALMQMFGGGSLQNDTPPQQGGKEAVKRLQQDLAADGLYPSTGKFAQDGITGDLTRHALRLRDEPEYAQEYMRTALDKKNLNAQDIMKIQASLNKLGYDAGDVNGRLNNETRDDIARYLRENPDTATSPQLADSIAPKTGIGRFFENITESVKSTRDNILAPSTDASPSTGGVSSLLSLIGKHESNQNYSAIWPKAGGNGTDFTKMTINEVLAYQDQYVRDGAKSSAVGRYQIIRGTMRGLVADMGLSGNELFDPAMQDKMATRLLEQRGLDAYREGRISETQFMNNVAKEWASMPKANGRGHYDGDGLNKVGVDTTPVLAAIRDIRAAPDKPSPAASAPATALAASTAAPATPAAAPVQVAAAAPAAKNDDMDFGRAATNLYEGMEGAAKRLGLGSAFETAGDLLNKAGNALGLTDDPQAQLAARASTPSGITLG